MTADISELRQFGPQDYRGELNLNAAKRKLLIRALKLTKGQKKIAAHLLGISEPTLYKMIHQHAITEAEYQKKKCEPQS